MTDILIMYICNFLAAELVKGTFIGVIYGRKKYLYYNFLTNIITNTIFVIGISLLFRLRMTETAEAGGIKLLILYLVVTISFITETTIYIRLFKASGLRAICLSIITNIITFIIFIILLLLYAEFMG